MFIRRGVSTLTVIRNKTMKQIFQILIMMVVLSIVLLSIIPLTIAKNERVKDQRNHLENIIDTQQLFIENWLNERMNDVQTLASLPSSQSLNQEKMREVFTTFAQSNENFTAIVYVDKNGIGRMDTNSLEELNVDLSDRQYYIDGKEKKSHISDVFKGRNTGAYIIVFSAPIIDKDGNFLGVVVGPVLIDTISEIMDLLKIGETGETYLADKTGMIFSNPRNMDNQEEPAQVPSGIMEKAHSNQPLNNSYKDYRGVNVIGTYTWTNNNNWLIFGKIDEKEVLQPFYQSTLTMFSLSFVVLFISYIIFIKIYRSIENSINYVLHGAKAIMKGEYHINHSSIGEGPKELQELCAVHNEMAATLEKNIQLIEESELRYKSLFDNNHDAVFSLDLEGRFTEANTVCQKISGYSKEEMLSSSFQARIVEEDYERAMYYFHKTVTEATPQNFEMMFSNKAGKRVLINVTNVPIVVRDEVIGVYGVAKDITSIREAELELKQLTISLRQSNEDLKQFAYVASHDLQEPLRMVTSYLQLLEKRYKDRLDEDANDFIFFAVDGAKRMQELINDLLMYSRVNTKAKAFTEVDCNTIVSKALANLQVFIDEKQGTVTVETLPTLNGDETQLIQLFQNLIHNGIKFTKGFPPEITIKAERRANEWLLVVSDNGIGISPEYQEQIFVIFQRLHSNQDFGGTGIGLAICKRIVERHGGSIWFESEVNKGTSFFFTIPDKNKGSVL